MSFHTYVYPLLSPIVVSFRFPLFPVDFCLHLCSFLSFITCFHKRAQYRTYLSPSFRLTVISLRLCQSVSCATADSNGFRFFRYSDLAFLAFLDISDLVHNSILELKLCCVLSLWFLSRSIHYRSKVSRERQTSYRFITFETWIITTTTIDLIVRDLNRWVLLNKTYCMYHTIG